MNRLIRIALLIGQFIFLCASINARPSDQDFHSGKPQVAVKTNLLQDAATTPNIGLEVGVAPHWTLQLSYGLNNWAYFDKYKSARHWVVSPEARYWFCHRFMGHFLGVEALGGEMNIGQWNLPLYKWDDLRDYRLEGWYVGGGLTYGYHWAMSRHWNFEAALGFGYIYYDYNMYPCAECGTVVGHGDYHYVGFTKLSLSLIYLFGK